MRAVIAPDGFSIHKFYIVFVASPDAFPAGDAAVCNREFLCLHETVVIPVTDPVCKTDLTALYFCFRKLFTFVNV